EGPLCAVCELLLDHLELQQEQVRRQEPAGAPVLARCRREDGGGQRWLRYSLVREVPGLQDLGRGEPAEGHALPLPQSPQPPDPMGGGGAGTAQGRRADLRAGADDEDGGASFPGRAHGKDARLGRRRTRRVYAVLTREEPSPPTGGEGASGPVGWTLMD